MPYCKNNGGENQEILHTKSHLNNRLVYIHEKSNVVEVDANWVTITKNYMKKNKN
jgi:hypothetical protein